MGVVIEDILTQIDRAQGVPGLMSVLDGFVDRLGLPAFAFVRTGPPNVHLPYHVSTTHSDWLAAYAREDFYAIDPIVGVALGSAIPFTAKTMFHTLDRYAAGPDLTPIVDLAWSYNYFDTLIFHYHGRATDLHSLSGMICLYWSENDNALKKFSAEHLPTVHLITTYFQEKPLTHLQADERVTGPTSPRLLTNRERDVLCWAARGKTSRQTAEQLGLSRDTVEGYIRDAIRKLGAGNRVEAVAKALTRGLITP